MPVNIAKATLLAAGLLSNVVDATPVFNTPIEHVVLLMEEVQPSVKTMLLCAIVQWLIHVYVVPCRIAHLTTCLAGFLESMACLATRATL